MGLNWKGREGEEEGQAISADLENLARVVIDAGLKVHRALGPGLLESVYEQCLAQELTLRGISVGRQVSAPVSYEGITLEGGYRIDLLVADQLILEIKAVEALSRLYEAQLRTYLRLSSRRLGFLMNFNVVLFKDGLRRISV
ncbi:GxxExxY protein [Caulobacter ginsengisoli]|uniref:GxxExxY protein n=1 Tax=Caulobacter ginsengisoli TaxID=400775 RepID=A0ABU0IKL9_9CAUL|nr:GxxExxY protein [Caulobacter ginsengisoli]MDQ0462558.1 GxxExxY protein [Caulobacter ginsengisoli]